MSIRKGMWVKYKGKIGIVNAIDDAAAELHLVDEQGLTKLVIPRVVIESLKQAKYSDIPEPRRPTAEHARRLGYEVAQ